MCVVQVWLRARWLRSRARRRVLRGAAAPSLCMCVAGSRSLACWVALSLSAVTWLTRCDPRGRWIETRLRSLSRRRCAQRASERCRAFTFSQPARPQPTHRPSALAHNPNCPLGVACAQLPWIVHSCDGSGCHEARHVSFHSITGFATHEGTPPEVAEGTSCGCQTIANHHLRG
jgi:hypothetical protein